MSLIVTGSVGIDSVESPSGKADDVLGGSAIYFAGAASYFTDVRLVAAVGDDFPSEYKKTFEHFGIDLGGLEERQGSKTFRWRGKYHDNLNVRDTLDVQLNVLGEAPPPVPEQWKDSEFVFLANTHPAAQMALLENFPNRKLAVADTMNLWIETELDTLKKLLKQIDGLVLNDEEAIQLTAKSNIVQAAEDILELGPKFVVIKKGEHGAFLLYQDDNKNRHLAALPAYAARDVADPTGAGDSFAGGMMGYLAANKDLSPDSIRKAMAFGTVVASYNIESFSLNRMKEISIKDIEKRLEEYKQLIKID